MHKKHYMATLSNMFSENAFLKSMLILVLSSNIFFGYMAYKAVELQKTVFVPIGFKDKITVEGNKVDSKYLTAFSRYVFDLALDYTKHTVKDQYEIIGSLMSPKAYHKYKPVFNAFIDDAKIGDVVSMFYINKTEHNPIKKIVKVSGTKVMIYEGTEVDSKSHEYAMRYSVKAGRVMIEEIGEWRTVEATVKKGKK